MAPRNEGSARRPARRFGLAAFLAAGWLVASGSAEAVVNGRDGDGRLARSAVMVLSSKGGVCSGVVLAPTVVLTAGHCAAGDLEHRVHFRSETGEPVLLEPAARLVHPGYDPGAVAGRRRSIDLALVRLREPLPARFVPTTLAAAAPARGEPLLLGGYGVSREGEGRSTGTWREAALAAIEPYGPSTILLWAADPAKRGAGACTGDSGGPIVRGDGAVAAVTTWAAGSGRARGGCGGVSQGVLVGPQRPWIDGVLAAWDARAAWR
ncbi:MAG: trypsin-like serine protease [Methylobacteriaceae bacterium]|nr:trypsin-like serine protease [Methylobacteriaceae bacterium]